MNEKNTKEESQSSINLYGLETLIYVVQWMIRSLTSDPISKSS